MASVAREFTKGLWEIIPPFRLVLGLCPVLAVTTAATNGLGMGLATTFVLTMSNILVSALRKIIPRRVRIAVFIVVVATFVVVTELVMKAYFFSLSQSLGIFIPLIVVNCIILGRAEAFASKHPVMLSLADGIGMGIGFTLGLAVLGACREILGSGSITIWGNLGWQIQGYESVLLMVLAPGGFIALGCLLGLMNHIQATVAARDGKSFTPPQHLDCRHCTICKFGE